MPDATHATVAKFSMDPEQAEQQHEGLQRMVVPSVRSSPGFVSGVWTLDQTTNESVVVVTFESVADAEAFVVSVTANAPHQAAVGIELLSISVVEVAAVA